MSEKSGENHRKRRPAGFDANADRHAFHEAASKAGFVMQYETDEMRKAHPLGAGVPDQEPAEEDLAAEATKRPRSTRITANYERDRALAAHEKESNKDHDRLSAAHGKRIELMRSPKERREEKTKRSVEKGLDKATRIRRILQLLRTGSYDIHRLEKLPDVVRVRTTPDDVSDGATTEVSKNDLILWMKDMTEYERQRLYVLGRKKIDFKMKRKDYPKLSEDDYQREVKFQHDQKKLADDLEVVALPMLRAVFKKMGKNVDVYLTSANDDIAGGLDVAIDFKKEDNTPELFSDGKPMRFVVDMTYARMKGKIEKDLERGRISSHAYEILRDGKKEVPFELSNARAMKLFRTVVETMGSTMSTQTFDKNGPMAEPQKHVARLIIGLDWESAFSSISNWVEQGDDFENRFSKTGLANTIANSIQNQLLGLYMLTQQTPGNPNQKYLKELLDMVSPENTTSQPGNVTRDFSLRNIDRLLTLDEGDTGEGSEERAERAKHNQDLFLRAALVEVGLSHHKGPRNRGDIFMRLTGDPSAELVPFSGRISGPDFVTGGGETDKDQMPMHKRKRKGSDPAIASRVVVGGAGETPRVISSEPPLSAARLDTVAPLADPLVEEKRRLREEILDLRKQILKAEIELLKSDIARLQNETE